jgi:hypothetical protein
VKPLKGIVTLGLFSSGVIFTPSCLKSSMLSACVSSVPLVGPEYRSVRKFAVPPRYSATVRALGLAASILPRRVLNSASVISLVRHSAVAAVRRLPLASKVAGVKGRMQVEASGVARMLVVVCRSFCAWRQTSCLSLVKVTSHSTMPAPVRAAAMYDSFVCSGNCSAAPRWPMEKSVRSNSVLRRAQDCSRCLSGLSAMSSTRK